MTFNAPAHRNHLQTLGNYVATATFIAHLGWKQLGSGHNLVDKGDREEKICIVMGKVLDYRLNCSTIGNYRKEYPPLSKAKFQFTLGRPDESALTKDFDEGVKNLAKAQGTIASTQDRRNMLVKEGTNNNIRFTAPIFLKRDKDIVQVRTPPPGVERDGSNATLSSESENENEVDEETNEWKVSPDLQEELDDIKCTHQAIPLKVYMGQKFVEPADVPSALENALVEVHFSISHYRIGKDATSLDSFSAIVQQVLILKTGVPKKSSPYKRKNFREGPVRIKPAPTVPLPKLAIAPKDFIVVASGSEGGDSGLEVVRQQVQSNESSTTHPVTQQSFDDFVNMRTPDSLVAPGPLGPSPRLPDDAVSADATAALQTQGASPGQVQESNAASSSTGNLEQPEQDPPIGNGTGRETTRVTRASASLQVSSEMGDGTSTGQSEGDNRVDTASDGVNRNVDVVPAAKRLSAKANGKRKASEPPTTSYNFRDGPKTHKI